MIKKFSPDFSLAEKMAEEIFSVSDVERSIDTYHLKDRDFLALISSSADSKLEEIAFKSKLETEKKFGKVKGLYIPLYTSNACHNVCSYCGYSANNAIKRCTLSREEMEKELREIFDRGYRSILLVAGELNNFKNADYLSESVKLANEVGFHSISVEFGALPFEVCSELTGEGAESFVLYQETYHPETYKRVHIKGKKTDFRHRLIGIERAIEAGFQKITLGFLGGLYNFRFEALLLYWHLKFLRKNFPFIQFCVSLPRINNAYGVQTADFPVGDKNFSKVLMALRIAFPDMPILLSTRESRKMREGLMNISVTHLSCESMTAPGGYENHYSDLEQFSIKDNRSLSEMAKDLSNSGFDICLKDWESALNTGHK